MKKIILFITCIVLSVIQINCDIPYTSTAITQSEIITSSFTEPTSSIASSQSEIRTSLTEPTSSIASSQSEIRTSLTEPTSSTITQPTDPITTIFQDTTTVTITTSKIVINYDNYCGNQNTVSCDEPCATGQTYECTTPTYYCINAPGVCKFQTTTTEPEKYSYTYFCGLDSTTLDCNQTCPRGKDNECATGYRCINSPDACINTAIRISLVSLFHVTIIILPHIFNLF